MDTLSDCVPTAVGDDQCVDVQDMMSEYASTPLADTDGDGLPDQCENEIFGTDPSLTDSDRDGIADGGENHDRDALTNAQEQEIAGAYECLDSSDMITETDAAPMRIQGPPPEWARAILSERESNVEQTTSPCPSSSYSLLEMEIGLGSEQPGL